MNATNKVFEVIEKEITRPKLTVASDRTTLKVPLAFDSTEKAKLEALARKIHDNIGEIKFTLRGRFTEQGIHLTPNTLTDENKEFSRTFTW